MKRDVLWAMLACTLALAMGCAKGGRRGARDVGAGDDRAEPWQRSRGIVLLDSGGRRIRELQAGSSLEVAATGLAPRTLYEFRLAVGGEPARSAGESVSFARASSDASGRVHPFVLWYHGGVVGCSLRTPRDAQLPPFTWRTFEEAQERLAEQTLTVSAHPIAAGAAADRESLMRLPVGPAASVARLPVRPRRDPLVYPSAEDGCLLNAAESGTEDLYVSGRNFQPDEVVEVAVVPNQRGWRVGDAIEDVTGANGGARPERVTADAEGRFTVRAWERAHHRRGAYDIIVRRRPTDGEVGHRIGPGDVASYGSDTAVLLFLRYPPGGPTMDIAGRPLIGSPYFQFADSFADAGDTVWGAVDPTYVPLTHPGGRYAAYYVVNHRDVAGWDPLSGGSTALADVSGGIEIMPVKAGCINATDVPIWHPPLPPGNYDVVVDFGVTPAETQVAYATDSQYDSATDFLDGADQVGFVVAPDPHALGTVPIGRTTYSFDDLFPTMGTATNVDLRAVVRYPATAAGDDTQVAPGRHPIFLIQHGNHRRRSRRAQSG